jgi:tetratricopeptide (TPR) repeat protein
MPFSMPALARLVLLYGLSLASAARGQGTDPQQLFQEALAAQKRGDASQAVKKYQQLIQLHPEMTAAHAQLGLVFMAVGRFDEAIAQYRVALAQAPGNPDLRLSLAMAYYQKGDMSAAAEQFKSLLQEEPGNFQIASVLANCYSRLGRNAEAVAVLAPLEEAGRDDVPFQMTFGWVLVRAGRTREGLERIEKVAQQAHSAEAYMQAATAEMRVEAYDKARRYAHEALRLNPDLPGLYSLSGLILDELGDHAAAQAAFAKALEANPNDFQAHLRLGEDLYKERKLDDARLHAERALQISRGAPEALFDLARVKRAQGQLDAALVDLQQVVRLRPEWIDPHVELAALYYRLKRSKDGAREKEIVDQLAERGRRRRVSDLSESNALSRPARRR